MCLTSYRKALAPAFGTRAPDVAEENIQARIRGNYLMALSNKFGSMLLSTGNKSELAVGYCTLYGDMAGGLAVISDVPKADGLRAGQLDQSRKGTDSPFDYREGPFGRAAAGPEG